MPSNTGLYCRKQPLPECNHRDDVPAGYVERSEWAARLTRTHKQIRCACGKFATWVKRKRPLTDKQMVKAFGYLPTGSDV